MTRGTIRLSVLLVCAVLMPAVAFSDGPPGGPVPESVTGHTAVYAPPGLRNEAPGWALRAECAYRQISQQLGLAPPGRIPLYLYAQYRDFRAAAEIRPHALVVGTSDSGTGLIRMDASGAISDSETTLRHEMVHSVLTRGLGARFSALPDWMNEGLAQIVDQPDDPGAIEVAREARGAGRLLPLYELARSFPQGEAADVAYPEAYSVVNYYVARFGWRRMRDLLARLRRGEGFTGAFEDSAGEPLDAFYVEWQESLVRHGWLQLFQLFFLPATTLAMIYAAWQARRTVQIRRRLIELDDADVDEPTGPNDADCTAAGSVEERRAGPES